MHWDDQEEILRIFQLLDSGILWPRHNHQDFLDIYIDWNNR
jgi:hypothetical protein